MSEPAPMARRDMLAGSVAVLAYAAAPAMPAAAQAKVGIASRHFQWTTMAAGVELAAKIGFESIEWSVRPGAHITPEAVKRDLAKAVALTRAAGLATPMISANILDADPAAEAIVAAAREAGISLYRGAAAYRWTAGSNRLAQLDDVKRRVAAVAAMNERHGATIAFHTYSGAGMIGGNLWDLLGVLRDFDARQVGFNYDLAHTLARNGPGWNDALLAAHGYIQACSVKDFVWEHGARGWAPAWTPIGEGMVDLRGTLAALLGERADMPVILQVEHHGLLGGDAGKSTLAMPVASFVGYLAEDLRRTRAALASPPAATSPRDR